MEIKIEKEIVHTIYQKDKIVAIIKREEKTGHNLIYLISEATSSNITDLLIKNNGTILAPTGDNQ